MKIQSLMSVLSAVIMMLVLAGCGSEEKRFARAIEKFGTSMDPMRESLGILPVPANVPPSLADVNSVAWMNGDADACYMVKRLIFDKGITVPISETDTVRCPEGMMMVETTYSADGKSIGNQTFKIKGKEMPADKAKALLKEVMAKDAARVIPPPAVEDAAKNK